MKIRENNMEYLINNLLRRGEADRIKSTLISKQNKVKCLIENNDAMTGMIVTDIGYLDSFIITNEEFKTSMLDKIDNLLSQDINELCIGNCIELILLLQKLANADLEELMTQLYSVEIDIFSKEIRYINNEIAEGIINLFTKAQTSIDSFIRSLYEVSRDFEKDIEKSIFRKNKYRKCKLNCDETILEIEKIQIALDSIIESLSPTINGMYKTLDILRVDFKYSKIFIK